MFCAISNTIPEEPVFAVKTGRVYERRLIEAAIGEDGKCPVTGEDLSPADLTPVKTDRAVRPRHVAGTSVPSLMSTLQAEWDATVMETFQLKKHLDTVRKELSQALYQHDAACRVIARLVKERDEARQALGNASELAAAAAAGAGGGAGAAAGGGEGLSTTILAELQAKNKQVARALKKRKSTVEPPAKDVVAAWEETNSFTPHLSTSGAITCLAAHPSQPTLLATGGEDKTIHLFDTASSTTTASLKGHSKAVTALDFHSEMDAVLSGSADSTVRLWEKTGGAYSARFALKAHTGAVTGLSMSPTGNYVVSVSDDRTWAFSNITTGVVLTRVADPDVAGGFTCGKLHPGGLILATGTSDNLVRVWDINQDLKNVANFAGHEGAVSSVSFSDNGRHVASGGADGVVKLWDLRKLTNFRDLDVGAPVTSVQYDTARAYLAVGTAEFVRVFNTDDFSTVVDLKGHSGPVTGIAFGANSASLATTSKDKTLKLWG